MRKFRGDTARASLIAMLSSRKWTPCAPAASATSRRSFTITFTPDLPTAATHRPYEPHVLTDRYFSFADLHDVDTASGSPLDLGKKRIGPRVRGKTGDGEQPPAISD